MSTTLDSIMSRLETINGQITGITRASKYAPQRPPAAADLPWMYSRFVGTDGPFIIGPAAEVRWAIELVVLIEAIGLSNLEANNDVLVLMPERIRDKYAARLHLATSDGGTPLLSSTVSIPGDADLGPATNAPVTIGEQTYMALHFDLRIKDKTSVNVTG